ncbi:MAG TPA: ATP-binding protein [Burkholderiaceae bacterium]|nr:ATP-binding protein [Burkholderiaceae bacterium]
MTISQERAQQLLWRLVQQSNEQAVLLLDLEGIVLWANPGAAQAFGAAEEELVGQSLDRYFTPQDVQLGIPQYERELARQRGTSHDDRWHLRADGTRWWAGGLMTAVRDQDGSVAAFAKVMRNRTQLKELLDNLHNRVEALALSDRQKNLFISALSHELRNPLAPLVNAVHLLRLQSGDAQVQYPVKLIERQVDFIKRLVDDLLDVTRIGAGKMQLLKAPLALRPVLERAIDAVRPLIDERRHRVDLVATVGPIEIEADADRLHQVFTNLLSNAAKYTPEGGRIWISADVEADEAVVRIHDNGIGIAPEMLSRIFDLFTQVDMSASRGGLGIGLSLVKELVALHGGTVQVSSDGIGRGSEFTVRLPLPNRAPRPAGSLG